MSTYGEIAAKYHAYMALDALYNTTPKEEREALNSRINAAHAEYEEAKARAEDERDKFQAGSL